jgi:hypothetical protein
VTIPRALIDEKTQAKLGDAGLAELTDSLWPGDCQTCGRPLGGSPPALCIDDMIAFAVVTLHHPECRTAVWNDEQQVLIPDSDFVTWSASCLVIPLLHGTEEDPRAALLVNPGLELVSLQERAGRWAVNPGATFPGLVQPGPELHIDEPVPGMVATLTSSSIAVTIAASSQTYESGAEEQFLSAARSKGGILLIVTHALHPAQITVKSLVHVMASGRAVAGWIALHGAARPAGPRQRALASET